MSVSVPVTIWSPTSGNGEYSLTSTAFIDDTVGVFLVDTVGNSVIDTGVVFTIIPVTLWAENDGQ